MMGFVYAAMVCVFASPAVQEVVYERIDSTATAIMQTQPPKWLKPAKGGYLGTPKAIVWEEDVKAAKRVSFTIKENPVKVTKLEKVETPKVATKVVEETKVESKANTDLGLLGDRNTSTAVSTDEILTYFKKSRMTSGGNEVEGAFIIPNQGAALPPPASSRADIDLE